MSEYKAAFLWPHEDDSVEEAGYEFANAQTEEYRKLWWETLKLRMAQKILREVLGRESDEQK